MICLLHGSRLGRSLALLIFLMFVGCQQQEQAAYKPEGELLVCSLTEKVEGKNWREWAVAWWQRSLATEKSSHPILDKTGKHVTDNQKGNVWFLHGTEGKAAKRKCTIPAGKYLFFPVLTILQTGVEEDLNILRSELVTSLNNAITLVKLDNKLVPIKTDYRMTTPPFQFRMPKNKDEHLYDTNDGEIAIAEGYWLLLKPLSAGKHLLEITGKTDNGDKPFESKVEYEITVEEDQQKKK
jgi:hypothetical protein